MNISKTTISRRRKKGYGTKIDEAGRVYRIVSLISLAESALNSHDKSIHWLKTPAKYLGGVLPFELLETEPGADEVRTLHLFLEIVKGDLNLIKTSWQLI